LAVVVGVGSTVVVVTTVVDVVVVVCGAETSALSVIPSANSVTEIKPKILGTYSMCCSSSVVGFYLGRWEYQ